MKLEKSGYIYVPKVLSEETVKLVIDYAKFQSAFDYTTESKLNAQVEGAHSRYADFLMEAILAQIKPKIEKVVSASLLPTYSYYRVYNKGCILQPHVDREACEVSASIAFGWDDNRCDWPFYLSNDKHFRNGTEDCHIPSSKEKTISIDLQPGDMLVYAGTRVKHWREALSYSKHVQGFFHYVYADGPNSKEVYDGRSGIGYPRICNAFDYTGSKINAAIQILHSEK